MFDCQLNFFRTDFDEGYKIGFISCDGTVCYINEDFSLETPSNFIPFSGDHKKIRIEEIISLLRPVLGESSQLNERLGGFDKLLSNGTSPRGLYKSLGFR